MKSRILCSNCVLPDSTPGITFDDNGVCNYCKDHKKFNVQGEEKLCEVLEGFRGKGKNYDCLVSISGGRDSTYALWKLVNDYKMRVLCVNYRNPFTSEQARINIQKAMDILGTECINWELPNNIHKTATRKALKTWGHHPSSSMIPIVCGHCKTTWPGFFKIAEDYNIPLIIIGSNPLETASFKKAGLGGARTYHKLINLPKIVSKALGEIVHNPFYLVNCSWPTVGKMYLMSSHGTPYIRWRFKNTTVLRLFDYLVWNEKEILSSITENLGWEKSPEVNSTWRFDCRLDYVRRLMYTATIGVSELTDLFSKMIRENQISRAEALERLETEDIVRIDVVKAVLTDLHLEISDLGIDLNKFL